MATADGSCAELSMIKESPPGPRAFDTRERRSTAAGVTGKLYRSLEIVS
jgi:hypothetical protein